MELVVFSGAEEVEVLINGKSIGRKRVSTEKPLPRSVRFDTVYQPGCVVAISYQDGKEISRDTLETTGAPLGVRLIPERSDALADGHDLIYVAVEIVDRDGQVVPDAEVALHAKVTGACTLAGFGSGNPVTEEDYTDSSAVTYRGRAMVILRSGYDEGKCSLSVTADGIGTTEAEFTCSRRS